MYGYMPSKTTIFNTKADATHSFALSMRNTILFSPHGKFVLVAGFGNLAGQMDIYDLEKDHLKICTIEASNASVCEWSPDGKHILTATTSPRLRVDNGVKIWHVGGGLMYKEDLEELYHVTWRPQSTTSHPLEDPFNPMPTPHASALAYLGTVKTPSKPAGAYRPPGARGQVTPLAFKREDEGGAAYISNGTSSLGFGKPRKREVPGAETVAEDGKGTAGAAAAADGDEQLSKTAAKNKKKREARKAKEAADKAAGLAPTADGLTVGKAASPSRSPERRDRYGRERARSRGQMERNRSREHLDRDWSRGRADKDHLDRDWSRGPVDREELRGPEEQDRSRGPTDRDRSQGPRDSDQSKGQTDRQARSHQGKRERERARDPRQIVRPTPLQVNGTRAQVLVEAPDLTITSPGGGGTPQDKKARALLKKLRAIDDLKMRRAGGEKLEGTQIKKMDTEEEVRKELQSLGWNE